MEIHDKSLFAKIFVMQKLQKLKASRGANTENAVLMRACYRSEYIVLICALKDSRLEMCHCIISLFCDFTGRNMRIYKFNAVSVSSEYKKL